MKVLFITMDSLEINCSANIRNRGLIYGLLALEHKVDTCSLEKSKESVCYDESVTQLDDMLNCRFFVSPNPWYERFRTKKKISGLSENDCIDKKMAAHTGQLKQWCKAQVKNVVSAFSLYDMQKINVRQIKNLKIDVNAYDVILSSSDPKSAHLFAYELWKRTGGRIPWVQYWGDPMYDDITSKSGFLKKIRLKREERRLLKKAAVVVYTSPFTLKKQQQLYPNEKSKMCYTVQACTGAEDTAVSGEDTENKTSITIGYFGDYSSRVRSLSALFQAADSLKMHLVVCGNGDHKLESSFIEYYPRLDAKELRKVEDKTDIIVCVCNRRGTQIPGKIYYESGCQKPIIVIVDGENQEQMRKFFHSFDRYIVCENSVQAVRDAVRQAVEEIKQGKHYVVPVDMQPVTVADKILKKLDEKKNDEGKVQLHGDDSN